MDGLQVLRRRTVTTNKVEEVSATSNLEEIVKDYISWTRNVPKEHVCDGIGTPFVKSALESVLVKAAGNGRIDHRVLIAVAGIESAITYGQSYRQLRESEYCRIRQEAANKAAAWLIGRRLFPWKGKKFHEAMDQILVLHLKYFSNTPSSAS